MHVPFLACLAAVLVLAPGRAQGVRYRTPKWQSSTGPASNRWYTPCSRLSDGSYQSPFNCTMYRTCTNGTDSKHICPSGLVWDNNLQTCAATSTSCIDSICFSGCLTSDHEGSHMWSQSGDYQRCGDCHQYLACRDYNFRRIPNSTTTGPSCIDSCRDQTPGDYQACSSTCMNYHHCDENGRKTTLSCPTRGHKWDDNLKACAPTSATCTPTRHDTNQYCLPGLVWDDNLKACAETSATCPPRDCSRENCYLCSSDGRCAACHPGYQVDDSGECLSECPVDNCDACDVEGACVMCSDGYTVRNGECTSDCDVPNCDVCDTSGQCVTCLADFVQNSGACVRVCDDPNCLQCNDSGVCEQCSADFFLNPANTCEVCGIENCETCSSDGSCETCTDGYMTADGACTPQCDVTGCDLCDLSGNCVTCQDNSFLVNGECQECRIANCTQCSSPEVCVECGPGFSPVVEGCEVDCNVLNCESCDLPNHCSTCVAGYDLVAQDNVCEVICDLTGCIGCDEDGSCIHCYPGLDLVEGACLVPETVPSARPTTDDDPDTAETPATQAPSCDVENCVSCHENASCAICAQGLELDANFNCIDNPCNIVHCDMCSPVDADYCLECEESFTLGENNAQCDDLRTSCEDDSPCHATNGTCGADNYCACQGAMCGDGVNACYDRCVCRVAGDPQVTTYDRQTILISGTDKYTLTKDMLDPTDPCSFNVEIKVTQLLRQQRVQYATTMPRYLDINILGYSVRLGQDHQAMVGQEEIDLTSGPYYGGSFTIRSVQSQANPTEDFIVLDAAQRCDVTVGFYGNDLDSVAVVDVPCRHSGSGRMVGLCGDCDGHTNDLRTLDGTSVEGRGDMFTLISQSYRVDDSVDNVEAALGEE